MKVIQVREYAVLTKLLVDANSLDKAHISEDTFNFLAELVEQKRLNGSVFLHYIKLDSQVGYLETPDIGLEILPKTALHTQNDEKERLRELLQKMVSVVVQVSPKEMHSAHLVRNNLPLHEWIYQQFLNELKILFREGLKRDYERVNRIEKFMCGRLDINQVMRQKAGQAHLFPIRYDEFNFNRLENRLIKTALNYLFKKTKDADNWRIANELLQRLSDLEIVYNGHLQLKHWQDSKLMKGYRGILPWCTLILEKMNPDFQQGQHQGIALLFPMEKLFEAYVGHYLKQNYLDYHVNTQEQMHYLVKHQDKKL
ncbi:MAG: 5-methylcytosine restriction system specificity protein McrC, partial [Wohlfahrtiimonas sp.]